MRSKIKKALKAKYEAQMEEAMLNIEVYMTNPAGIGEHPEIIEAIDSQIEKWCDGKERLEALMFIQD